MALCYEQGCSLTARAGAGYVFEGWYSDSGYTQRLSTSATYAFRPQKARTELYARFKSTATPLDGNGTANCYIAPNLRTFYSFDATVQGNGRSTQNVTPQKLSGVEARILWETGSVRNAVIRSAEYSDGRICFETGSVRGNAVIGLFDTAGTCIWSWHIWAVAYDPLSTARTYSTGAVFMDRNLGAETTSLSDVRSKGMYYQWGRKDPFIYPASNKKTDNYEPATVACLEGYEFKAPGFYATLPIPEINYTIQWSIEHPTVVMVGNPNSASWSSPLNPNLWGNYTDGSNASTINHKTIYDPCPPGWRVPHKEAWDKNYFKKATYVDDGGWYMYYSATGSSTTLYPFSGYLDAGMGRLQYYWPVYQVRIWTNTPVQIYSKDNAQYLYILDESGIVAITDSARQDEGIVVRCIRE